MTPAEHYARAEALLTEVYADLDRIEQLSTEFTTRMEALNEASALQRKIEGGLPRAQVHATLATVSRDVAKWAEVKQRYAGCTCPTVGDDVMALASFDPACPIHGATP